MKAFLKERRTIAKGIRTPCFFMMLCVFVAIVMPGCSKEKKTEAPPTVEVADVVQKDVPIFAEWVGTLDGMVNATIRAQVQGYLSQTELQRR